jgi:hypothetical protein
VNEYERLEKNRERFAAKYAANPRRETRRTAANANNRKDRARQTLGGKCSRCRCDDFRVLQFDHVAGGGSRLQRSFANQSRYYTEILRTIEGGGSSVRLLCATCNAIDGAARFRDAFPWTGKAANTAYKRVSRWRLAERLRDMVGHKCRRCPESHPDAMQFHHVGGGGQVEREAVFAGRFSGDRKGTVDLNTRLNRMIKAELAAPGRIVALCANCHVSAHLEERDGIFRTYPK